LNKNQNAFEDDISASFAAGINLSGVLKIIIVWIAL
jgi:hypothetical protein